MPSPVGRALPATEYRRGPQPANQGRSEYTSLETASACADPTKRTVVASLRIRIRFSQSRPPQGTKYPCAGTYRCQGRDPDGADVCESAAAPDHVPLSSPIILALSLHEKQIAASPPPSVASGCGAGAPSGPGQKCSRGQVGLTSRELQDLRPFLRLNEKGDRATSSPRSGQVFGCSAGHPARWRDVGLQCSGVAGWVDAGEPAAGVVSMPKPSNRASAGKSGMGTGGRAFAIRAALNLGH